MPRDIIYKVRDDLTLSTGLLYAHICLSGLDMGGSHGRHLASFSRGRIAITGGTEGPGTYGLPPTKILSNRAREGLKLITSIAMIPLEWAAFKKYVTCINNKEDLSKRITGNKPRIFKLIINLGSEIDITQIVEENAINMAQGGIIIEVKRLRVIHSKKALLIAMLPKMIDLKYVQEMARSCLIKVVHQTIEASNESALKKIIAKEMNFKILVNCWYPPLNFEKFKKGNKSKYNAQYRQMFGIEYNVESKEWIFQAAKFFKILFHKFCGLNHFSK